MMTLLVLVIIFGLLALNFFSKKQDVTSNIGESFSLIDQNGNMFFSKNTNKKKLIYFGYTYCPDICPMDVLKISKLFDDNPNLNKNLLPIFISIDPDRDRPETLKDFIENFNSAFIALTGSNDQINQIIKDYRIYVKLNKKNNNDLSYLVDHSSLIFLMDENDNFITFFRTNDLFLEKIEPFLKKIL
jgi:protein SCO1/2